jgi:hypothetical protein
LRARQASITQCEPSSRRRSLSGRAQGSVEAVEDEVEPVLVLAAVVVAGLEHVLEGELGEIRVLIGGELRQHGLGEFGSLLAGVERQARFLQREAVDITVEDRVGMGGQRDRASAASSTRPRFSGVRGSAPRRPGDAICVPILDLLTP